MVSESIILLVAALMLVAAADAEVRTAVALLPPMEVLVVYATMSELVFALMVLFSKRT